jgi:opacity protein-like surface antigen
MRRSLLLAVCTLVFVAFAASSAPVSPVEAVFQSSPTTPIVIAQSTQYGVFLASQATGSISFCANSTFIPQPSGGTAPAGACKALGTIPPSAGSNNSLSMIVGGISVFVFNNQTGKTMQCAGSGVGSGATINPIASCKAL